MHPNAYAIKELQAKEKSAGHLEQIEKKLDALLGKPADLPPGELLRADPDPRVEALVAKVDDLAARVEEVLSYLRPENPSPVDASTPAPAPAGFDETQSQADPAPRKSRRY